jgi:hypothetical protein
VITLNDAVSATTTAYQMGMTINSQSTKLIQKLALSFLIDQDFPDNIGSDVSDLATAHSIAVRLMKRVMMFSSFSDCAPDLRRWTVKVTDERRRPVFTVIFPTYFVPRGWKPVLVSGARALLRRLDAINAVDDMSRVRVPAPPRGAFEARVRTPVKRVKEGADHWAADRNNGPDPPGWRTILTPCRSRAASRRPSR